MLDKYRRRFLSRQIGLTFAGVGRPGLLEKLVRNWWRWHIRPGRSIIGQAVNEKEAFLLWDGNCSASEEVPEKTLLFRVRRERWPNHRFVPSDLI